MNSLHVDYTNNFRGKDYDVHILLEEATIEAGFDRAYLRLQNQKILEAAKLEGKPVSAKDQYLFLYLFPDLCFSATEVKGLPWPLPYSVFRSLPENLISLWEHAAYEVNPHWKPEFSPVGAVTPEAEKKSE